MPPEICHLLCNAPRIPPLSSSYTRSGLVVDDDDESVCEADRYTETDDKLRLVSSVATGTGTGCSSDYFIILI